MDINTLILFLLAAYLSEVAGTLAGFGSSTLFMPLALFLVDFRIALVMVAVLHISGNLGRLGFFKKGLDYRIIILFGVPSVILTILGAFLVDYVNQDILKLSLGLFLIFYVIWSRFRSDFKVPPTRINTTLGGGLSGFLAGLIGTGGALRAAFLTGLGLKKEVYLATAAAIALGVDMTRLPIYLSQSFLPEELFILIPFLVVTALAGSYTGKKLVSRISAEGFRKVVLGALLMMGVYFVLTGSIMLIS
ncbi:MAG: sulfite exporter TauE/SafE family protein [Euryarchaeota archaeon]|nr:sulfite exporter TauE/SafE family protein [Euryarchaeota archaeon]MBU4608819.1 sulfite exporter TauE/SafE family protein [Euryarchaeota archaeon]MBV1730455.1 sulfite exporter TauE/SafE family protein [Methanobacterium sp.]MBV1754896.1 sulfite exporter TauE/SafE family protein [Methanobacterium sp.]